MSVRLVLSFSLIALTVFFLAVGGMLVLSNQSAMTTGLQTNLARRQQVLLERISWKFDEFERAETSGQREAALRELADPVWLFDMSILALEKGGGTIDDAGKKVVVPVAEDPDALAALRRGYAIWALVGVPLIDLTTGAYEPDSPSAAAAVQQFRDYERTMAKHMDQAARAFQAAHDRPRPWLPLAIWILTVLFLATASVTFWFVHVESMETLQAGLGAVISLLSRRRGAAGDPGIKDEVQQLRASLDNIASAIASGGAVLGGGEQLKNLEASMQAIAVDAGATDAETPVEQAPAPEPAPVRKPEPEQSGAASGSPDPGAPEPAPATPKKSTRVFKLGKGVAGKPAAPEPPAPPTAETPAVEPAPPAAAAPEPAPATAEKKSKNVFILNKPAAPAEPAPEKAPSMANAEPGPAPDPEPVARPRALDEPAMISQEELDAALAEELDAGSLRDDEPADGAGSDAEAGPEPAPATAEKKSKNVFILNP